MGVKNVDNMWITSKILWKTVWISLETMINKGIVMWIV